MELIRRYTREAGVRNLEREIASICRKIAKEVVSKTGKPRFRVTANTVSRYLGVPKFRASIKEDADEVGLGHAAAPHVPRGDFG